MVLVVIVLVAVSGISLRRVVPAPGGLCGMIWPPIASTRSLSPARPMPREVDRDGDLRARALAANRPGQQPFRRPLPSRVGPNAVQAPP